MGVTIPAKRRVLVYGDKGPDVLAYQRAVKKTLAKLGLIATNRASGLYGKGTLADTIRLETRLGLQPNGKVGLLVWIAIDPQLDAYGKALLTPKPKPPAPAGSRIAHEARVLDLLSPRHYTQARPYAKTVDTCKARGSDCSGTSMLTYKDASVGDPNGTAFNGYGNTYSLIQRGTRVTTPAAGDLTFYGPGHPEHVVVEVGDGQVVSHGSEGGPRLLPRHYRGDYLETRRYA